MAKKPSIVGAKAGNYRAWDGKLTGPDAGDPASPPERNQTWGSVQRKQGGKLYTLAEVEEIVSKAVVEALQNSNVVTVDVPQNNAAVVTETVKPVIVKPLPEEEEAGENIIIRGQ